MKTSVVNLLEGLYLTFDNCFKKPTYKNMPDIMLITDPTVVKC